MATALLKQLVYNLEDYGGSGGLISTDKRNDNELVCSTTPYLNIDTSDTEQVLNATDYENNRIDIYSNVLAQYSNVKKIGIQAPPGTKFTFAIGLDDEVVSSDRIIMVGRTGIYELNDDIVISSLKFIRPQEYVLNEELSKQIQIQGTAVMKEARDEFLATINQLTQEASQAPDISATGSDYWEKFNKAHQIYIKKYQTGLGLYLKGKSGMYTKKDNSATDLYNIIIDFTYESKTGGGI